MSREQRLIQAFTELADALAIGYDQDDLLQHVVEYCLELVPVDAAGVLLAERTGELRVVAASSREIHQLEILQAAATEGPCVEALRTGEPALEADLNAATQRWPTVAPRALEMGLVAAYGFPLRLRSHTLGAFNLFQASGRPPLEEADQGIARGFARIASMALLHNRLLGEAEERADDLRHALDARVVVEQAKGLLAGRLAITPAEALERLRSYARDRNRLLREVAQDVLDGRIRLR